MGKKQDCLVVGCGRESVWKSLCIKHYQQQRVGKGCFEQAQSIVEYIESRIAMIPVSGCHLWTGYANKLGYGVVNYKGKRQAAHRAAWAAKHGAIPPGMQLNHKCDVPSCVNPDHLYLGNQKQNIADMIARGRIYRKGESHHGLTKLTEKSVIEIRQSSEDRATLSSRYGVSMQTITDVRTRRSWSHI